MWQGGGGQSLALSSGVPSWVYLWRSPSDYMSVHGRTGYLSELFPLLVNGINAKFLPELLQIKSLAMHLT